MSEPQLNNLFVYGTLLKDFNNDMSNFLLNHSEFIGDGFFKGKLYEVDEYPGAVLSSVELDKVYGSLYEIKNTNSVFKVLDAYEGLDEGLFKRQIVDVYLVNKTVSSWVYIYNGSLDNLNQIVSGIYLK